MIRLAALALLALAFAAAGCGESEDERAGTAQFEITVPEDWRDVTEQARNVEGSDVEGATETDRQIIEQVKPVVAVARPPEDGFATNVNVIRRSSIAPDVSLEEFRRMSEREDEKIFQQEPAIRPFDVTPDRKLTVAGEPAIAEDFSRRFAQRVLRLRQTMFLHEGSAYLVTYTAPRDAFDDGIAGHDEILRSWRWK